jgi:hypothetical protein
VWDVTRPIGEPPDPWVQPAKHFRGESQCLINWCTLAGRSVVLCVECQYVCIH